MNAMYMVAGQVTTQLHTANCIPVRHDWDASFANPIDYFVGNMMGIGPKIAIAMIAVASLALILALRSSNAPKWIKVIGQVFGGLMLLLFVPALVLGMIATVPTC